MTRFPQLTLHDYNVALREYRITDNENIKKINAWSDGLQAIETITEDANTRSEQASQTASDAENRASTTQQQLDAIVLENGNSDAEVVQARGEYDLLYQRLEAGEAQTQDIDTELNQTQTNYDALATQSQAMNDEITQARAEYDALATRLGSMDEEITWSQDDLASREVNVLYPPAGLSPITGDGIADDTTNFEAIVEHVQTNGGVLSVPAGVDVHLPNGGNLFGIRDVNIEGRITGDNNGSELIVGIRSGLGIPYKGYFNRVEGLKLRVQGIKNGSGVSMNYCDHLLLWADGNDPNIDSISYSTFLLGNIKKFEINSTSAETWINENLFIGGRITELIVNGGYKHNHNIWLKPTLENSTIDIDSSSSSWILYARLEGDNTISFGENAWDNTILRSWHSYAGGYLRGDIANAFTDNGINNQVLMEADAYFRTEPIYDIHKGSNNYHLSYIVPRDDNMEIVTRYNTVFESGLIPVTEDFGVFGRSDQPFWRLYIKPYDSNKNPITDNRELVLSGGMQWSGADGDYRMSADSSSPAAAVLKNKGVAYVKIRVVPNSLGRFEYFRLFLRCLNASLLYVPILPEYQVLRSNSRPSNGTFEKGMEVMNADAGIGSYRWFSCISEGSPGTWASHSRLEE